MKDAFDICQNCFNITHGIGPCWRCNRKPKPDNFDEILESIANKIGVMKDDTRNYHTREEQQRTMAVNAFEKMLGMQ